MAWTAVGITKGTIAIAGATGYVGGRLAPRLLELGYGVRCLVRSPEKLDGRAWAQGEGVEVLRCNFSDQAALTESLRGCAAAYYLVHSMVSASAEYAREDRRLAETFGAACAAAVVGRILYLGGLGETGAGLSEHLRRRREVEGAL